MPTVVFHAGCLIGNTQVAAYCIVTGTQVAKTALLPKKCKLHHIAGAYFTDCRAGYIITYTVTVLATCRLHHALVVSATCRPQLVRAIRA